MQKKSKTKVKNKERSKKDIKSIEKTSAAKDGKQKERESEKETLESQKDSKSAQKIPIKQTKAKPLSPHSAERIFQKADISKFDPNGAGNTDAGVFGLNFTPEESNIILIPVPWEATTSYGRGTSKGPAAILAASPQLDLFDASLAEKGLARPWEFGIWMEDIPDKVTEWNEKASKAAQPIIRSGGKLRNAKDKEALEKVNHFGEKLNDWVFERASTWLESDKIVGLVGGDHSVSFGAIKACAEKHPGLGILHIDAHADLRIAYEGFQWSHASIMNNVLAHIPGVRRLVQVGIRDFCDQEYEQATQDGRIRCYFDYALKKAAHAGRSWDAMIIEILSHLPDKVYVSFDVDGLEPWLCPNTGTPVPGGLTYDQAIALVEGLIQHGKSVVGFDLNEVAPDPTGKNEWDGNVGARLLYKLCGVSLLSNGARTEPSR
jgi:agmatinase